MDKLPAGYLREDQALAVLNAYGLPVPEYKLCQSADEAVEFAEKVGYPVVLRLVSPQIIHKTEVKGVAGEGENKEWKREERDVVTEQGDGLAPNERHQVLLRCQLLLARRKPYRICGSHDPEW